MYIINRAKLYIEKYYSTVNLQKKYKINGGHYVNEKQKKSIKIFKKRIILTLLSVMLLFILSSCGGDSLIPDESPLPTDEIEGGGEHQGNEQNLDGENQEEENDTEEAMMKKMNW